MDFVERSVTITKAIKSGVGPKLKDFKAALADGPAKYPELVELAADVKKFANGFPTVGY